MKTIQNCTTTKRTFRTPLLALRPWITETMYNNHDSGPNPETQWLTVVHLITGQPPGRVKDAQSHSVEELNCLNPFLINLGFRVGMIQRGVDQGMQLWGS